MLFGDIMVTTGHKRKSTDESWSTTDLQEKKYYILAVKVGHLNSNSPIFGRYIRRI